MDVKSLSKEKLHELAEEGWELRKKIERKAAKMRKKTDWKQRALALEKTVEQYKGIVNIPEVQTPEELKKYIGELEEERDDYANANSRNAKALRKMRENDERSKA